jgi:hypothetical protein
MSANPISGRRFLLAERPGKLTVAVGPVFVDASEAKLRTEIEAAGWRVAGVVAQLSAADFRALQRTTGGAR